MLSKINLLGSFYAEDEGKRASPLLTSNKGSALVAYLLITKQPESRETLVELLWEPTSRRQGLQNLRDLLRRLRPIVPELQIKRQMVAIQPHPNTIIDLYQLQEALQKKHPPHMAMALKQYHAPLLADFSGSQTSLFTEWLHAERAILQSQIETAYQVVCRGYLQRPLEGLHIARQWVQRDPKSLKASYWHLYFLAHSGQPELALTHFATLSEQQAQLPQTQALIQTLQAQKLTSASQTTKASTLPPSTVPPNSVLPYHRYQDFVGRETLLQTLARLLPTQSVVLTGPSGIGKTQLAVEFAHRYGHLFPDGIHWMPSEPTASPTGLVLRIFDDYAQSEALPPDWQAPATLITSRRVDWQTAVTVPPLTSAASIHLLQKHRPDMSFSTAQALAERLGHLPLALYLAGQFLTRYQQISPETYLHQLNKAPLHTHPSMQGHGVTYSPTNHSLILASID